MESLEKALEMFERRKITYNQFLGILEEEFNHSVDPNELRKIANIAYYLTSRYFPQEKYYFEEFI